MPKMSDKIIVKKYVFIIGEHTQGNTLKLARGYPLDPLKRGALVKLIKKMPVFKEAIMRIVLAAYLLQI